MKKDLVIMFCSKCNWKIVNPDDSEKTNTCPKCHSWTFEISQFYYYKDNNEIGREFNLTDNDEISFNSYDFKEAKRLMNKAFKLFDKEINGKV